jgi:hypothetical protein
MVSLRVSMFFAVLLVALPSSQGFGCSFGNGLSKILPRAYLQSNRCRHMSAIKMSQDEPAPSTVDRRSVIGGLFTLLVTAPLAIPSDAEAA